jgi:hypothetical protein
MNDFDLVVETFVSMLEKYHGSNPVFQIDFHGKRIIVKEAPSGFIKAMVNYPGSLVSLREDGFSFQIINYGKES